MQDREGTVIKSVAFQQLVDKIEVNVDANDFTEQMFVNTDMAFTDLPKTTNLKPEDSYKLRASLVLDFYKQQLDQISDKDLSFADREKKEKAVKQLGYLANVKVQESNVLKKVFDMYKHKVSE